MVKNILRIAAALVFIASGFVKAVDCVGFSFKLEEYFSPSVLNLPFFEQLSLPIAVFVVIVELFTGILLLLNIRAKKILNVMIALCIFFAFLTFDSAYFNKVTDCGCFGDALKFTPWQSFFKDIALLILLIFLRFSIVTETPASRIKITITAFFSAAVFLIIYWGIAHEPLIDFRDYKIGTDIISERKKIAENPSVFKTFYLLKNTKTGAEKSVSQDDYVNDKTFWESGSPWKIETGQEKSLPVKEGYHSEISKFKIENTSGEDITESVLESPLAILVCSYKPANADKVLIRKISEKLSAVKDAEVLGISTDLSTFPKIKNAAMDETALKTVARSNPFVLILRSGKITEKMSAKDYLTTQK